MITLGVIIYTVVVFGGGWFCKGKFGAVAAADLTKAQDAVAAVKKVV